MKQLRAQQGFTLIELVVVISVLSLFAATLFPRLLDLEAEVDATANEAIAAAFNASIQAGRVEWLLAGSPGKIQNLPGFADGNIDFNSNGWPIGIDKGSANNNVGQRAKGCFELWNALLISAPAASADNTTDYQSFRHSSRKQCSYILRRSGDTSLRTSAILGIRYFSETGRVTVCGRDLSTQC